MLCKESNQYGIQLTDLKQVIDELINWRKEIIKDYDSWNDPVRLAMIDSFEDIILNALVEGD